MLVAGPDIEDRVRRDDINRRSSNRKATGHKMGASDKGMSGLNLLVIRDNVLD